MKLSISIMAHESREHLFPYLKQMLGDIPFSIDKRAGTEGHIGIWENCKRAWGLHDPTADYHVVIQDDGIICKDFNKRAIDFLTRFDHMTDGKRDRAFSFYFGNKKVTKAIADEGMKVGYATKEILSWGVAICLPVSLIPDMIATCDTLRNPQDDVRIAKFLHRRKMTVYYPMPSLVSHRAGEKSLVGDPGQFRKAQYFIDDYANQ